MKIKLISKIFFLLIIITPISYSYSMENEEENNETADNIYNSLRISNNTELFGEDSPIPMDLDQPSSISRMTSENSAELDLLNSDIPNILDIFASNNQVGSNENYTDQNIIAQNSVNQERTYEESHEIEAIPEECLDEFQEDRSDKQQNQDLSISENNFQCPYTNCSENFRAISNLKKHIVEKHVDKKRFKCYFPNCDKFFAKKCLLITHIRIHTGEKPYKCIYCSFESTQLGNLKRHINLNHEAQLHENNLDLKEIAVKSNAGIDQEKSFLSEQIILKCPYDRCNNSFTAIPDLLKHIIQHLGPTPYKCKHTDCGKSFRSIESLNAHMSIHTHEKPYKCTNCETEFQQASNLKKHMARAHKDKLNKITIEEEYHQCNFPNCNAIFAFRYQLEEHEKKHQGQMDSESNQPTYAYNSPKNLTDHKNKEHNERNLNATSTKSRKRKHSADLEKNFESTSNNNPLQQSKVFTCSFCDFFTNLQSNLEEHIKTHIEMMKYECTYLNCEEYFTDLSCLKKHIDMHKTMDNSSNSEINYACSLEEINPVSETQEEQRALKKRKTISEIPKESEVNSTRDQRANNLSLSGLFNNFANQTNSVTPGLIDSNIEINQTNLLSPSFENNSPQFENIDNKPVSMDIEVSLPEKEPTNELHKPISETQSIETPKKIVEIFAQNNKLQNIEIQSLKGFVLTLRNILSKKIDEKTKAAILGILIKINEKLNATGILSKLTNDKSVKLPLFDCISKIQTICKESTEIFRLANEITHLINSENISQKNTNKHEPTIVD